jgi:hypothetical protein
LDLGQWQPSRREKALLHFAEQGAYDDLTESSGHESPFSFILAQLRRASSTRSERKDEDTQWEKADAGYLAEGRRHG